MIKVESAQGDRCRDIGPKRQPGRAPIFLSTGGNKRSMVLDLKRSLPIEVLQRMVETADVFARSMRPPRLGEHPRSMLEEQGYGEQEIAAVVAA